MYLVRTKGKQLSALLAPKTLAGAYTITISATSGSQSQNATHSQTVP
jgi:hypothetical protein